MNSYLLVDTAEIGGPDPFLKDVVTADSAWVVSLYRDEDYCVSPLLIDVEAAETAGAMGTVSLLVQADDPPLHISYLESPFGLESLLAHLRKFILVRDESGEEFTFRFADGLALEIAASVFSTAQTNAFFAPFASWRIHRMDGAIDDLGYSISDGTASDTPLVLDEFQCDRIDSEVRIYSVHAYVRRCATSKPLPGSLPLQLEWVKEAVTKLRNLGWHDEVLQKHLGLATVRSKGALFTNEDFGRVLESSDQKALLEKAKLIVEQYELANE